MSERTRSRAWRLGGIAASLVVGTAALADEDAAGESLARLAPEVEVVYLLANSSLIFGPDAAGPAEDVTFTGTVAVPKNPVGGFGRRRLPDGRFQIDLELTDSRLRGESYRLDRTVVLGEHPELRSPGTIEQVVFHVAYAVDPVAIYRAQLAGSVEVEVDGQRETIAVQGPVEALERAAASGGVEVVTMALRGESELLGGPIMLSEAFAAEGKLSLGRLGLESAFDLHLEIDTPSGALTVQGPVHAVGKSSPPVRVGAESLGGRGEVPVFDLGVELAGGEGQEIVDPAGLRVGNLARLRLHGASPATGRRPCCPLPPPRAATGGPAGSR